MPPIIVGVFCGFAELSVVRQRDFNWPLFLGFPEFNDGHKHGRRLNIFLRPLQKLRYSCRAKPELRYRQLSMYCQWRGGVLQFDRS